jgi:hypothetical protein
MMQVANVKQVAKPELISKVYETALSQKADKVKVQESNVVDLQKQANFKRMFEAYSDCV